MGYRLFFLFLFGGQAQPIYTNLYLDRSAFTNISGDGKCGLFKLSSIWKYSFAVCLNDIVLDNSQELSFKHSVEA